ncbi:MAG: hypothetical protein IT458_11860 [Planctomycetes bacterium]|nr:hypothetical protein [Planctomycetota bacterium]
MNDSFSRCRLPAAAAAVTALLATFASAQRVVSPSHFAATEGNSSGTYGLGDSNPFVRYLQIHDDLQGQARTIQGLSLRAEGLSQGAVAAFSVQYSLTMSTATTRAANPAPAFDVNHGTDKATVAAGQIVNLPMRPVGNMPREFEFRLPLQTPFVFAGSGPLCFDLTIMTRSNTSTVSFDGVRDSNTRPSLLTRTIGTGCRPSGRTSNVTLSGSSTADWTKGSLTLSYTATAMNAGSPAVLSLGLSNTSIGGLPLPLELPGTTGFPSRTCYLYQDALVLLPLFVTGTGTANLGIGLGLNPGMNGDDVFAQVFVADAAANALGAVTSNLYQHHVVAPFGPVPVGHVVQQGAGGTPKAVANQGAVVAFD